MAELSLETRRSYEAHWMVDQVHESILKGFPPERIEADTARAEKVMERTIRLT